MTAKLLKPFRVPKEMEYMLALAAGERVKPPADMNWELLQTYAEKNRLIPQVVAGGRYDETASRALATLARQKRQLTERTMRQIQLLAGLMGAFQKEGLRVLTMKGPLLAAELYGDPSLRYSNDLDLLVFQEDYHRAKEILVSFGFRGESFSLYHKTEKRRKVLEERGEEMHERFLRDDICVELHWRITFRYRVETEELWERRELRTLLGQPIPYIGPEDNLIYLICHGTGHGYSRLRWLVDLYRIFGTRPQGLGELYSRMADRDAGYLLLATVLLLYRLPGFRMEPIREELFSVTPQAEGTLFQYDARIREDAEKTIRLLARMYPLLIKETDPQGMEERFLKHVLPVVDRKQNIRTFLWWLVLPQEEEMERFDLPDKFFFLYFIIRPFYKLWRLTPFWKKDKHK